MLLKSKNVYKFASLLSIGAIAQLVEHRTENPGVPGSIPGGTTSLKAGNLPAFFVSGLLR